MHDKRLFSDLTEPEVGDLQDTLLGLKRKCPFFFELVKSGFTKNWVLTKILFKTFRHVRSDTKIDSKMGFILLTRTRFFNTNAWINALSLCTTRKVVSKRNTAMQHRIFTASPSSGGVNWHQITNDHGFRYDIKLWAMSMINRY